MTFALRALASSPSIMTSGRSISILIILELIFMDWRSTLDWKCNWYRLLEVWGLVWGLVLIFGFDHNMYYSKIRKVGNWLVNNMNFSWKWDEAMYNNTTRYTLAWYMHGDPSRGCASYNYHYNNMKISHLVIRFITSYLSSLFFFATVKFSLHSLIF